MMASNNHKGVVVSVVALVLFGFCGGSTVLTKGRYDFVSYEGYQEGLRAAQTAGKPILLDFYFDT